MTKQKLKSMLYWPSVITFGVILGISLQLAKAWSEPAVAPPGGNVGAPINIGDGAQTKGGLLTLLNGLVVSQVGGAYSSIILKDDESPNGVKYVHANSNVIGFLSGAGSWLQYWTNGGDSYQTGYANADDFYIRKSGKWASQGVACTNASTGWVGSGTATCPSGYTFTGGSCDMNRGGDGREVSPRYCHQNGNGMYCAEGNSGSCIAYAYCCK